MDFTNIQFPPPSNWQDLERLSRDVFAELWGDPDSQRNGRQGQHQHGVDIYGRRGSSYAGVQCKGKDAHFGGSITPDELDREVKKAQLFSPPLASFTVVTTARTDQKVQAYARELTERHRALGLFGVDVMGWDEFQARLAQFPDIIRRYYPQFFSAPPPLPVTCGNEIEASGGPISDWFLDHGAECFKRCAAELEVPLPAHAAFEVAVIIPNPGDYVADRRFLDLVTARANNRWWGWSLWMNPQMLGAQELQPYVIDDAWEANIVLRDSDPRWTCNAIDFWRAWPLARLYQRRALWEDGFMPIAKVPGFQLPTPDRHSAVRELDPVLQILHVAEAIEAGIRMANLLQSEPTQENIDFGFRWTGLRNRILLSRLRPGPYCAEQLRCMTGSVPGQCYVHASTELSEIPRLVHGATARLFRAFNGFSFEHAEIDSLVREFLRSA